MNDKTKDATQGADARPVAIYQVEQLAREVEVECLAGSGVSFYMAAEMAIECTIKMLAGPSMQIAEVCQDADGFKHIESVIEDLDDIPAGTSLYAAPSDALAQALAEIERLNAIINTPHADDFMRSVSIEAEHQRQRWGAEGDAGKTPADWFWLVGYLAGKALHSHAGGNVEKGEHHIITTAAVCANWHRALFGKTDMRPGHEEGTEMLAASAPREKT